jgi:hypothetical protein
MKIWKIHPTADTYLRVESPTFCPPPVLGKIDVNDLATIDVHKAFSSHQQEIYPSQRKYSH